MTLPVFAPGDRVEVVGVSQGSLAGATGTITHVHPSNLVSIDTDQLPGIHLVSTRRLRHPHPRPVQHPASTSDARKRHEEVQPTPYTQRRTCGCGLHEIARDGIQVFDGALIHQEGLCTAPDRQDPGT